VAKGVWCIVFVLVARTLAFMVALAVLSGTDAAAKEATSDTDYSIRYTLPLGRGKPATATIIRRCTDGRELVIRANGALGCAKDIVSPKD